MAEPSGYGMETLEYGLLIEKFNALFEGFNSTSFNDSTSTYIGILNNRPYTLTLTDGGEGRGTPENLTEGDKEALLSDLTLFNATPFKQLFIAKNIIVNLNITSVETLKRNYFPFVKVEKPSFNVSLYTSTDNLQVKVQWRLHPKLSPISHSGPNVSFGEIINQLEKGKWMEFQSKFHVKLGSHHMSYYELAQLSQSEIVFKYGNYLRYKKPQDSDIITLYIPYEAISIKKESSSPVVKSSAFNLYGHLLNTSSLTHFVWDIDARQSVRNTIALDNSQLQLISVLWYSVFQPIFANAKFIIDGTTVLKEFPFLFNLIEHKDKFLLKNFEIFDNTERGKYVIFHSILINIPLLSYQLLNFLATTKPVLPRAIVPVAKLFYQIVIDTLKFSAHAIRNRSRKDAIFIFRALSNFIRVDQENEYQVEFKGFSGYDIETGVDILSSLTLPNNFLFYLAHSKEDDKITNWSDGFLFNYRANYPDVRDDYFQMHLQEIYFKDETISPGLFLKQTVFNLISGIVLYAYTCCLETVQSIRFSLGENVISIKMDELISPTFGDIKDTSSLISYAKQVLIYFGTDVLLNKLTFITGKALQPLEVATSILITSYLRFLVLNIMQSSGDLPSKDTIYTFMATVDPAAHFKLIATVTATVTSILTLIPTAVINAEKVATYFSSQLHTGTLPLGPFQFYYFVLSQCTTLPKDSSYTSRLNRVYERYYLRSGLFAGVRNPDITFSKFQQKLSHRYNDLLFFLFVLAFEKLNLLKVDNFEAAMTNLDSANSDILNRYEVPFTPFTFEENQDKTSKKEASEIAEF